MMYDMRMPFRIEVAINDIGVTSILIVSEWYIKLQGFSCFTNYGIKHAHGSVLLSFPLWVHGIRLPSAIHMFYKITLNDKG